jgi:arginase
MQCDLILVPYDSGYRATRMGRGPETLADDGVLEKLRVQGHDVARHTVETTVDFPTEASVAFDLARSISDRVRTAVEARRLPIILAGNCMAALGAVAGLPPDRAVVWLDAHGDFNTPETTRTAFLDGMSAAVLTGWCWSAAAASVQGFEPVPESSFVHLGGRDLDAAENTLLAGSRVTLLSTERVNDCDTLTSAFSRLGAEDVHVYVHIDLDVLDPAECGAANRFAAPGGLSVDDVLRVITLLGDKRSIGAVTISAYDPAFDHDGNVKKAALAFVAAILNGRG